MFPRSELQNIDACMYDFLLFMQMCWSPLMPVIDSDDENLSMVDLLLDAGANVNKIPSRLNTGFRADLAWWQEFQVYCNLTYCN